MTDSDSTSYDDAHTPGLARGIEVAGVEMRSRMAAVMTRDTFPATRTALISQAESQGAEPAMFSALNRLPESVSYDSVADVAAALGFGHEQGRDGSRS